MTHLVVYLTFIPWLLYFSSLCKNAIKDLKKARINRKWIKENLSNKVYISVMAQYFPTYKAKEIGEINRKLTKEEYKHIEEYLYRLNLENGYIQELGEHEEEYVPKWDND